MSIIPPVVFICIGRGSVLQTSILRGQTAPKLRLKKAKESSKDCDLPNSLHLTALARGLSAINTRRLLL